MEKNIYNCELEYSKCFCTDYEDENIVRFRNPEILEMYSHNYTFLKTKYKELKIRSLFEEEIALRKSEKADYCHLVINSKVNPAILSYIKHPSKLSVNGVYHMHMIDKVAIANIEGCELKKFDDTEMVLDMLSIDLDADEAILGRKFVEKRCYGRAKVYLSEKKVDAYILYYFGEPIGRCDLFVHENTAKLEDFSVVEKYQRKGFGTLILQSLKNIAFDLGCKELYLVTSEMDTAKSMYLKNGFSKCAETTEVWFKL